MKIRICLNSEKGYQYDFDLAISEIAPFIELLEEYQASDEDGNLYELASILYDASQNAFDFNCEEVE